MAQPILGHAALRAELEQLIVAFWFEIDQADGSRAASFFTPDAELRFDQRSHHGTRAIDRVYADRAARGARVSRHVTTNLVLTSVEQDTVTTTSVLLLFAEDGEPPRPGTGPAMVGDVVDVFERHDQRWLIRSRHVRYLFIAPETTLAVPSRPDATAAASGGDTA